MNAASCFAPYSISIAPANFKRWMVRALLSQARNQNQPRPVSRCAAIAAFRMRESFN